MKIKEKGEVKGKKGKRKSKGKGKGEEGKKKTTKKQY